MINQVARELRVLAKNFSKDDFQVISTGLGIQIRRKLLQDRSLHSESPDVPVVSMSSSSVAVAHERMLKSTKQMKGKKGYQKSTGKKGGSPHKVRPLRSPLLLAFGFLIDAFVLVLVVGMLLAGLALYLQPAGHDLGLYMSKLMQQFYAKQSSVRMGQGITAFLCVYWLVFKLLVGSTLGQATVRAFHRQQ